MIRVGPKARDRVAGMEASRQAKANNSVSVRRVRAADMAHVIALDDRVTGLAKPSYWHDIFQRYGKQRLDDFRGGILGSPQSRRISIRNSQRMQRRVHVAGV